MGVCAPWSAAQPSKIRMENRMYLLEDDDLDTGEKLATILFFSSRNKTSKPLPPRPGFLPSQYIEF